MRLVRGISYHTFGENDAKVYVHSVDTQKDYILEGIALDVLNCFEKNKNVSFENLCETLSQEYDVNNKTEFEKDIRDFVEELLAEKILTESEQDFEDENIVSGEVTQEVENFCAKSHKLYSLALELTYRCVEKCVHCYIDDASKFCVDEELSIDEWKNILRQAREMGCMKILLTGGEVLLRKDFCEIAEYAVSLGLIVNVYTTGLGMTDEIFDHMTTIKLNSVSFSIYGGNAAEHDAITGIPGSFEKTLKAMMMFKCAGVATFIKCVVVKQNFDYLENVYKLAKRLRLRVSISPQIASGHEKKCASDFRLDEEQYKKFFALESRYSGITPIDDRSSISIETILKNPPCSVGQSGLSIDPFGGVHPCISFYKPFGSLKKESLKNLWDKVTELKCLRDFKLANITPKCRTCDFVKFCHVCLGNLLRECGDEIKNCGDTFVMARARASVKGR